MNIALLVDSPPTLYFAFVAFVLFCLGRATASHFREAAAVQEAAGALTFLVCAIRRFFWSSSTEPQDVFSIGTQLILLSAVAYGTAGVLTLCWNASLVFYYQMLGTVGTKFFSRGNRQGDDNERKPQLLQPMVFPEPRFRDPDPPESEEDKKQRESERLAKEEDRRKKMELRLQTELLMEFALDHDRREKLVTLLNTYADEKLSVNEYESRLEKFRDAIQLNAPARATKYHSLQEILNDFASQLAGVDDSAQSEFEKDSLRAMIMNERQITIQRFIQS